jgi:hypothetical protein
MSALARQQRELLALVKGRTQAFEDPYVRRVMVSHRLTVVRTIAIRWRMYQIEAQCRYTSRLCKRLGIFESRVERHFSEFDSSPHIDELSAQFLNAQSDAVEPLVRAVAATELALLRARAGQSDVVETRWDRNPDLVFRALENFEQIPPSEDANYLLRIACDLPNFLECLRLSTTESDGVPRHGTAAKINLQAWSCEPVRAPVIRSEEWTDGS